MSGISAVMGTSSHVDTCTVFLVGSMKTANLVVESYRIRSGSGALPRGKEQSKDSISSAGSSKLSVNLDSPTRKVLTSAITNAPASVLLINGFHLPIRHFRGVNCDVRIEKLRCMKLQAAKQYWNFRAKMIDCPRFGKDSRQKLSVIDRPLLVVGISCSPTELHQLVCLANVPVSDWNMCASATGGRPSSDVLVPFVGP